jgi:putative ABC transport system permease protein
MRALFDIDTWQEIAATLRSNRLRALLTASGVFWGLFMLILMLGLGRGLENGTRKNLAGLAPHAVYVWGQRTGLPYRGLQPGRNVRFESEDIRRIAAVPGVEHVAPRLRLGGWRESALVSHRDKTGSVNVLGDVPEFARIESMPVVEGRFLNEPDLAEKRKVVVLGRKARAALFSEGESALGDFIAINGVHFRVVGEIRSEKGGEEGDRVENSAFVPFTTFQQAFNQPNRVGWFSLSVRADASSPEVEKEVRRVLSERHGVHPNDQQAIGSFNAAEQFGKVQGLFRGIRTFVWFVGTLTLLAGVLGVSNILLIIVKERTRELGIRKALGATPASIVGLILQESVALTALSGYAGLVAGVGALELLGRFVAKLDGAPLSRPEVDLEAALIAAGVLVVAGAIAGIVPARHAARVAPVEALRAE